MEFAGDCRSWELQIRHFGRRYRAVAFNVRGYPPSDVPEPPASYRLILSLGSAGTPLPIRSAGGNEPPYAADVDCFRRRGLALSAPSILMKQNISSAALTVMAELWVIPSISKIPANSTAS